MNLDKTREFFSGGGVLFSLPGGKLAASLATLGLLGAVAVIPQGGGNVSTSAIEQTPEEQTKFCTQADAERQLSGIYAFTDNAMPGPISLLSAKIDYLLDGTAVHKFGKFELDQYIATEIVNAARDTGFPSAVLFAMAEKESAFDPEARPPMGSALGLMQFLDQTWLEAVREHGSEFGLGEEAAAIGIRVEGGNNLYFVEDPDEEARILSLRRDPYLSAVMAARRLQDARMEIEREIGTAMHENDLYLPHFLGTSGAKRLLARSSETPDIAASKVFPKAARFNRRMFTTAGRDVTVRELHERLANMIEKSVGKYRDAELRVLIADSVKPDSGSVEARFVF